MTSNTTRWNDMKTIVNDKGLPRGKGKHRKKFAINENTDYDEGDDFMGRVGGKYDLALRGRG